MHTLYLMSKVRMMAFRFMEQEMAREGVKDIPPSYGDVLFVITRREGIEMSEIGRLTSKDKSTITGVIKELEKHGYVRRERDEEDRRRYNVFLTPKARMIQDALMKVSRRFNRKMLRGFSRQDRNRMTTYLHRMRENLE